MKTINLLMAKVAITKNDTLTMTLHRPAEEANPYERFGYGRLKICNNTGVQVSGSMNSDPINMLHTSQQ